MSQMGFVHLNVHSEFSMVDSIVRIKKLVQAAKADGQRAVAITDHHNLFAAVKFFKAATGAGVKPIIGADLLCLDESGEVGDCFTCLCMNETGYGALVRLVTRAYVEGQHEGRPYVRDEWLSEDSLTGLIILSGGNASAINKAIAGGDDARARQRIEFWQTRVGDRFYINLQRIGNPGETSSMRHVLRLAETLQVPVVATNAVCFIAKEDFTAHEARVCIHEGNVLADPSRPKDYTKEQYFKAQVEMRHLFEDVPAALQNTVEIAKRCNLKIKLGEVFLPNFPIPEGLTIEQYIETKSLRALEARLPEKMADPVEAASYQERLKLELGVINSMGFPGYFLIVADFIQWAKDNDIPVGPGRGSGAGSLVAYVLGITDLDPLRYQLLFERFLNPERVSMPDFDVDFCMERRDEVIHYVSEKYGRDCVSQIITYGTMAAKAVIRDVGRVLGHPYGFVDKIAKLIPFEIGMTLEKALEQEPELARRVEEEEEVKELMALARTLEGVTRNAGKHAGGVVIAPSQLTDFTALYCEAGGKNLVTQFDKDDVEQVGLVKFDFLGLRTLTIIQWACQNVVALTGEPVDITQIPLDDVSTFALLKACHTTAVFQLESRGMKELIGRLQPDCFEDIIALVALFRPGPLQSGMVDDFINRKKGLAEIVYPHDDIGPILQPTYGVILYQEQVMQIAQVLAGYTLGAADMLRRAMGKKKPEEMAKQRDIFVKGAQGRGVEEALAASIFDLMEKFAGYGFNKSHSAAYALIAYQTAWLKAHHTASFMAAVMSSDMDNTDKVVYFMEDAKEMGLKILPPDINESHYMFGVTDAATIRFGLGAVKGVGESVIQSIVTERQASGPYQSYFDFFNRVDRSKLNRRTLEALIYAGVFDSFSKNRGELLGNIDLALQQAQDKHAQATLGQGDLFSSGDEENETYVMQSHPDLPQLNKLQHEKATLGFYLSGHPYDCYAQELKGVLRDTLATLPLDKTVTCAGLVVGVRILMTKRGKRLGILTIEDSSARRDVTLFQEVLDEVRGILEKDSFVIVQGETSRDEYTQSVRVVAQSVLSLDSYRLQRIRQIRLKFHADSDYENCLKSLQLLLKTADPGPVSVLLNYRDSRRACELALVEGGQIQPDGEWMSQLQSLVGKENIEYVYAA